MANLKYNPFLKLGLQEETDAEDVIGDGYNEKLLTWQDFLNDCDNILVDTGEVRKYYLSVDVGIPSSITCNFSFELFANRKGVSKSSLFHLQLKGKKVIFHDVYFYGAAKTQPFDFVSVEEVIFYNSTLTFLSASLPFSKNSPKAVIKIINSVFWGFGESTYDLDNAKTFIFLACWIYGPSIPATPAAFNDVKHKITIICDNYITNHILKDSLANVICIDNQLDLNSKGFLRNNVITAAIKALQPDSMLDSTSSKPVMNSAVTTEINQITQIIENFQDINVANLTEFEDAIVTGQTANVRIHLTADITLTESVVYNLDKIQIFGHDHNINLENNIFSISGNTCYFYQVRFNANSAVTATSADNYSNAAISIFTTANSTRFFFEYVIFRNFICKNNDVQRNIINIKNSSGVDPSIHLYLMFCEVMTNYMNSNINNGTWCINHTGSYNAITLHNIDYWGNSLEANSTNNFCFVGNNLEGAAKLAFISDGSCFYNQIAGALTPTFKNIYNPSRQEFDNYVNNHSEIITESDFNNLQNFVLGKIYNVMNTNNQIQYIYIGQGGAAKSLVWQQSQ